MLCDATREAAKDLENLKIINPERSPEVAALRYELRKWMAKDHNWIAKEARSISKQAKQSSARHREELAGIKKAAQEAAAHVSVARNRSGTPSNGTGSRRGRA
jgi:hypothetical protein